MTAAASSSSAVTRHVRSRLLRGTLFSRPGPAGQPAGSYVLPCRKIVLEYCPRGASSVGTRDFLTTPTHKAPRVAAAAIAAQSRIVQLAQEFPSVEVVIKEAPHKHPLARGFYMNGRTKEISLRNLPRNSVSKTLELLLNSSGKKIVSLKRKPVESITESARGIWSALHAPPKQL
ncbi:hypothetical protein K437DRAFT_253130 [Tilletiaria anomala UBC 951]|uniref:Large ribosomal subunit protein mL43 n=1 Tax=Tilletiaria anomala (strain ATCC 24038 / CBS 436.72 / UBC 951) TaxID=1037660 RepID=A0A066WHH1_TILAU|nr:uncharacterized protein K437DRAFT_253130 [Tilletiaria anomala UBC 951]KDN53432.1 hypothetical protein K437DRAFT_253130 [Tilletiaria anomala UBC 951]